MRMRRCFALWTVLASLSITGLWGCAQAQAQPAPRQGLGGAPAHQAPDVSPDVSPQAAVEGDPTGDVTGDATHDAPAPAASAPLELAQATIEPPADQAKDQTKDQIKDQTKAQEPKAQLTEVIDHASFDALLKKHVDGAGQVAYGAWHGSREDRAALKAYVEAIAQAKPSGFKRPAQLAFYINAYNALVIWSVLERHPVQSVMKIEGFFKAHTHRVAGEAMTLDALEHQIIRPRFKDARVHFVLVCAAKSCPRLRRDALTHANVYAIMERATREFVRQATTRRGDVLETSQLFAWFKEDFVAHAGSVERFLIKYLKDKDLIAALEAGQLKLQFTDYDWGINAR